MAVKEDRKHNGLEFYDTKVMIFNLKELKKEETNFTH